MNQIALSAQNETKPAGCVPEYSVFNRDLREIRNARQAIGELSERALPYPKIEF